MYLHSMTGYGTSSLKTDTLEVEVTIRTVNSKGFDLNLSLSERFRAQEGKLKSRLADTLQRGRIQCQVKYKKLDELPVPPINQALLKTYFDELKAAAANVGVSSDADLFQLALTMPEVRQVASHSEDEMEAQTAILWKSIQEQAEIALQKCLDFRVREGKELAQKLQEYLEVIAEQLLEAKKLEAERIPKIRQKLEKHMKEFVEHENFEAKRFEQELLYYAERLDVTEEQDRLEAHLQHFR
ncbi:MAG: YicC/YloC family endoribonuclease, partial [Bacteroidota bacterium]